MTPATPAAKPADGRPRRLRKMLAVVGATLGATLGATVVLLTVLTWISTDRFGAFGAPATGARLARMRASPQFTRDHFENPEPTTLMSPGSGYLSAAREWFFGKQQRTPLCPLPIVTDVATRLATPPASGLRVTWLGHSTTLIEIDGARVLTDPIWSERASPSRWAGPRRLHPPPLPLDGLPPLDAVLISHEHYDHLDMRTIQSLVGRTTSFHVPLGVGAHLEAWGVPPARIVEHDWWQEAFVTAGVRVVSTPSRHFNGRGVPWREGALWTSWSIVGPRHRVFFSGDTGLTEGLREIGARFGPFDAALIEIGRYHPAWGDIHLGPEGALEAFTRVRARTLIPIHWATFVLAYHAWSEPAETLLGEAQRRGLAVLTPRPGEPVEPAAAPPPVTMAWWRAQPPLAPKCP